MPAFAAAFTRFVRRPPLARLEQREDYRWWVVATVCIGAFLGQLDASIASLALPTLEQEFHVSVGAVEWVSIAYLVTLASLVVVFGRVADMAGRKPFYTLGFLVFIAGSALCGAAGGLEWLLAARVLQGAGAAMLQANSVALITRVAAKHELGRALGIQTAAQAIGLSVGPAVGGLIISVLDWRWVFYIAVPAGLLGAVMGQLALPAPRPRPAGQRFDWAGAVTFAPAVAGLMYALSVSSGPVALLAVAATALFGVVFLLVEARSPAPLVDLSLFRSGVFSLGLLSGLAAYALMFGVLFLVPFFLERVWAAGPAQTGLLMTAIPVGLALASPFSGLYADRGWLRLLTTGGMLLALAGVALLAPLDRDTGAVLLLVGALAAVGVGVGLFLPANNSAVMGAVPDARLGVGSGMLNMTRGLGTALGVAATGAVLLSRLSAQVGDAVTGTEGLRRVVLIAGFRETLVFLAALALAALVVAVLRRPVVARVAAEVGEL